MTPFTYPTAPHIRRHGPGGYSSYERYRPWLRDEFDFRCVYCLKRERWGAIRRTYELDHFLPQARRAEAAPSYDNLVYACATCNSAKRQQTIPDPCECLLQQSTVIEADGSILATTPAAAKLIRVLGLNDAEYREFRRLWIGIVSLALAHDKTLFHDLMAFPDDLPNLAVLRPRENSRPEGAAGSWFARRERGELLDTYA